MNSDSRMLLNSGMSLMNRRNGIKLAFWIKREEVEIGVSLGRLSHLLYISAGDTMCQYIPIKLCSPAQSPSPSRDILAPPPPFQQINCIPRLISRLAACFCLLVFLSFNGDERPFPSAFADWPVSEREWMDKSINKSINKSENVIMDRCKSRGHNSCSLSLKRARASPSPFGRLAGRLPAGSLRNRSKTVADGLSDWLTNYQIDKKKKEME